MVSVSKTGHLLGKWKVIQTISASILKKIVLGTFSVEGKQVASDLLPEARRHNGHPCEP